MAKNNRIEIHLGHVLPGFFVLGALVNLALTTPNWNLHGFARVALHASGRANYSADSFDLVFAPVDADIIEDAANSEPGFTIGADEKSPTAPVQPIPSATEITTPAIPTPSEEPTLPVPTLPVPTLPLPTLPIPTLPLPTLPNLPLFTDIVPDLLP